MKFNQWDVFRIFILIRQIRKLNLNEINSKDTKLKRKINKGTEIKKEKKKKKKKKKKTFEQKGQFWHCFG